MKITIGIIITYALFLCSPQLQANASSDNTTSKSNIVIYGSKKSGIERTVFGVKISPYVKKVLVTLNEKNVAYNLKEILPTKLLIATKQAVPAEFAKISPLGKIPAYQEIHKNKGKHGQTFFISDSSVIMEYLEQTIKNNPLRPICPKANARVYFFTKYADENIAPITHKILFEKIVKPNVLNEKTDEVVVKNLLEEQLPVVLDFLENTLSEGHITWIADTKNFSLADISVVTHLSTLIDSGMNLDQIIGNNRPNLLKYVHKVLSRNSFSKI